MRLSPLPSVGELIRLYKLRASKHLAQNFLLDMNLTRKIVRSAGNIDGGYVCEVGPGPGGLTRCILESNVEQLVVIEKDKRFMPALEILNEASDGKMRIFQGDVLQFDMTDIFPSELRKPWDSDQPNLHIIGNLPFNVSTPLIIKWLRSISERSGAWTHGRVGLTLTFQKEVGQRIVAPLQKKHRSRISIMSQCYCKVKHVFTIPGKAFVPAPKVDVAVVHFEPRKQPVIDLPFSLVEKVIRHVFHFRPKQCKRGIETLFPPDRPELTTQMVTLADIDPTSRPFMLSLDEFKRLCHAYKHICEQNEGVYEYDYRSKEGAYLWRTEKLPLEV